MDSEKIIQSLFKTEAVKICPHDKPFWYTSGKIGPYYINTHYLYGSGEKAEALLKIIDEIKTEKLVCPLRLAELTRDNYNSDPIYREIIDMATDYIRSSTDVAQIDYISGGERRDWFFSFMIAEKLNKPHLTIYKDLTVTVTENGKTTTVADGSLAGKKVMHIAELVTEASSYGRAWIPAVEATGAKLVWTQYIIDRKQGGEEFFAARNIVALPMVHVDEKLFDTALKLGLINKEQYDMLVVYYHDPDAAMRKFIAEHPDFLEQALHSDPKTAARAKMCIEQKIYG